MFKHRLVADVLIFPVTVTGFLEAASEGQASITKEAESGWGVAVWVGASVGLLVVVGRSAVLVEVARLAGEAHAAIVEAAVRRARPIMLTAAAAVLAMIPLSRSVFWGPMAVAIMGGLIVPTALTLLFLPALYAAAYRVRRPRDTNATGAVPQPA